MESEVYSNAAGGSDVVVEEQPPSYESAVATQPPADTPPTYQSLFGDLQRAKKESNGVVDFLKNLTILLFSTVGFLVLLGGLLAIPIACLVIGLEYREDCRIQSYIPIYLIVFGAFGIFRNVLCLFNKCKEKLTDSETADGEQNPKKSGCTALTDLFLIIWFICGNIWVYGISLPDFNDKNSSDYCNATLYLFAFWLTTSVYIFIGALCTCCCFLGCCAAILSDSDE